MEDPYLKDDPFNLKAKDNAEAFGQGNNDLDVEASLKTHVVSPNHENCKNFETLDITAPESGENLGLDALNTAIDKMDVDNIDVSNAEKGVDIVHETPEIPDIQKDVGPDVETSLGQQGQQVDAGAVVTENDFGFQTVNENENLSTHTQM
jgi:hypothetical protein